MSTPETNLSATHSTVDDVPPKSAVARKMPIANVLVLLVRRELWEHRALWIAPLVVVALLIGTALFLRINMIHLESPMPSTPLGEAAYSGLADLQQAVSAPMFLVVSIVLGFYLLDCMYVERRDRSILFWKSLPVSDGMTVASKFLVALVVVPLGAYVLTVVESLVLSGILLVKESAAHLPRGPLLWDTRAWLRVEGSVLLLLVREMLWLAPVAGYLVLVSAWARRNPFLWATLTPVIACVAERIIFGTYYLLSVIKYRTLGDPSSVVMQHAVTNGAHTAGANFDFVWVGESFLNVDVWLGLAVTAVFAFAAVRIRRYRDDT